VSAAETVQAALLAALGPALPGVSVFDVVPPRAALPWASVDEPQLAPWGGSGVEGAEARMTITLADAGETPARLRGWLASAIAAATGLSGDIGDGWHVASAILIKARTVRSGTGWRATADVRVRVARAI
jgi:hypothetical protein